MQNLRASRDTKGHLPPSHRVPVLWPWVLVAAAWAVLVLAVLSHQTFLLDHHYLLQASGLPWLAALEIFLLCWQVMTVAMMLPSSMPMVNLVVYAGRRQARPVAVPLTFLAGYAVIWTAFATGAFLGDTLVHRLVDLWPWLAVHCNQVEKDGRIMSTQPFDPARYKAGQRREWDIAAPGFKDWGLVLGPELQPVSDRMMELADIQPGQRVLDVATGPGEPAFTAARRVGPSGHVIATDLAPQMLALGREWAAALGLQNIDFREMDAEAPDLPENSFEIVLCRFGLMYLPNPQVALERLHQLLVPDGRLVAAVWGSPHKVPFARWPMEVAIRVLQVPAPPPQMPGPFSLADPHQLEQLLTQAGFTAVHTEPMLLTLEWASVDDYTRFQQAILTGFNTMLAKFPAERQAEVWQAIAEAAGQSMTPDGTCRTENELILAVGRRGMEDNLL
jgi:SAM-dependent methyltransferase